MPGYKTHIVGGAVTFAALAYAVQGHVDLTPSLTFQWLGAAILGSLFPDVDIKSKGQGIFYKGMLLCLILLLFKKQFYPFVILSFLGLVPVLVRHRGLFHRPWFVVVLPLALAFVVGQSFPDASITLLQTSCFFAAGALSHLLLDRMV